MIPARGGSKSIPLKNMKLVAGTPLVVRTIEVATTCGAVDRVVVSTDHQDITEASRLAGAEVIARPEELARDTSRTEECLLHVLEILMEAESYGPDIVLTLEPTSPLRSPESIRRCVEMFADPDVDSVVSVVPRHECMGFIRDGRFHYLIDNQARRRQEREGMYAECGVVYGTRTCVLKETRSVVGGNVYAMVVDEVEALDINTPLDLQLADFMFSCRAWQHSETEGQIT